MIDRGHDLPLTKQASLLNISRGIIYYVPEPTSAADLALMLKIDKLHLELPFAGARMLSGLLAAPSCSSGGSPAGRRHVTTLMRKMGIEAVYRRPNTSKRAPGHKIYPYLLRDITIDRPNQVWATDITTSQWRAASSICAPSWTGGRGAFSAGDCRIRWKRSFASKRWRRH